MNKKKQYLSNWLSNTSVATIVIGGFQVLPLWLRIMAFVVAILAFLLGLVLVKED